MQEQLDDLVTLLTQIFNGDEAALAQLSESPVDYIDAQTSGVDGTVDPAAIVAEALANSGLDPATQQAVLDAINGSVGDYGAPADGGYSSEQLADIFAQGINITVEEGDQIHIDNSLYVDGDVKGGIHQNNVTNLTQADDGAIIANDAHGSNFQTGEGNTQLTGVDADNITTGDNNTVASSGSTIGNENVNAGHIDNSEFGAGDQDRSADVDVKIDDSFSDDDTTTEYYSDDDNIDTTVDIDVKEEGGYHEVPEVHHDYDHEPDPHDHDHDYDH